MKRIAIIAEHNRSSPTHQATDTALKHTCKRLQADVQAQWLSTQNLTPSQLSDYSGLWIGTGSPYKDLEATLQA